MLKGYRKEEYHGKHERGCRIITLAATIKNMNRGEVPSDVNGSYTGMTNTNEAPVQDADDL